MSKYRKVMDHIHMDSAMKEEILKNIRKQGTESSEAAPISQLPWKKMALPALAVLVCLLVWPAVSSQFGNTTSNSAQDTASAESADQSADPEETEEAAADTGVVTEAAIEEDVSDHSSNSEGIQDSAVSSESSKTGSVEEDTVAESGEDQIHQTEKQDEVQNDLPDDFFRALLGEDAIQSDSFGEREWSITEWSSVANQATLEQSLIVLNRSHLESVENFREDLKTYWPDLQEKETSVEELENLHILFVLQNDLIQQIYWLDSEEFKQEENETEVSIVLNHLVLSEPVSVSVAEQALDVLLN